MTDLFAPLAFRSGHVMKNRFMLAPLTNTQSHADGVLSAEEFNWLTMRAKGGFGLTMTCAAHVQRTGQGFPGQLGVWSDHHIEGLSRLAAAIKAEGSLAVVQLHHAGVRAPAELIGEAPVGPSADEKLGARAMSGAEVEALTEDFIAAAVRAQEAGFDGVEVHGAHGYVLSSFVSPTMNRREDRWGGSLENRSRIIFDILEGIQARCGPSFSLGLRLSPERFGQVLPEVREVAARALAANIDFLDMSLWDVRKAPNDEAYQGKLLLEWFSDLPRHGTRLGAAGKIMSAEDSRWVLHQGCDFAVIGRAAILCHDLPMRCAADPAFVPPPTPVSVDYLASQGLSPAFVEYMRRWEGFVEA